MSYANDGFGPRQCSGSVVGSIGKVVYRQLNSPYAVSAIAAMLLEHPRLAVCQLRRQLLNHLIQTGVEVCIAAPDKIARAIKNFLRAHLEDDVGMGTDENTSGGNITKQRIEHGPVPSTFNGIDPYQNAVYLHELFSNFLAKIIVIDRRLDVNPPGSEGPEQICEPAILGGWVPPRLTIARRENG